MTAPTHATLLAALMAERFPTARELQAEARLAIPAGPEARALYAQILAQSADTPAQISARRKVLVSIPAHAEPARRAA